jgi:hypothetical protein
MQIVWNYRVTSEKVLGRVKEERGNLPTIKRTETKWIGHILRGSYPVSHIIEAKIEEEI